jgi:hypothetical protein
MANSEWLSPRKMREYYLDWAVSDLDTAEKQLYLAVIKGEIRARLNGRLLGPEWLTQIEKMKFHDGDSFAQPPDIELSVDDAKRKWPR